MNIYCWDFISIGGVKSVKLVEIQLGKKIEVLLGMCAPAAIKTF